MYFISNELFQLLKVLIERTFTKQWQWNNSYNNIQNLLPSRKASQLRARIFFRTEVALSRSGWCSVYGSSVIDPLSVCYYRHRAWKLTLVFAINTSTTYYLTIWINALRNCNNLMPILRYPISTTTNFHDFRVDPVFAYTINHSHFPLSWR